MSLFNHYVSPIRKDGDGRCNLCGDCEEYPLGDGTMEKCPCSVPAGKERGALMKTYRRHVKEGN